jgi:hypothetical protein
MEMHSNIRHSVATLALLSLLTSTIAFAESREARADAPDGQSRSQAKRLEGTWVTEVTIRDCNTGAIVREFQALNTFAQGGTLIDTTTAVGPALRSPGHGTWEKIGGHRFRAFSLAFLFNPTNVWTGTQTVTQAIQIGDDPDELTSTATSQIFDTGRNLVNTFCSTAVAHRIE